MAIIYVKSFHPLTVAEWQAQIAALPQRKRTNWSARVRNDQGVDTKVRYDGGFFEHKLNASTAAQIGDIMWPKHGWAPIIVLRTKPTFEQLKKSYGTEVAEQYTNGDVTVRSTGVTLSDAEAVSAQGRDKAWVHTLQKAAENHTWQHHRNKHVSVPTAAGEPVRG